MLTSFLSEHPHDLICIVAGYKEALQKRFFSQNEGLSRRFTHRFELSEYDGSDLRQIFFKIIIKKNDSIHHQQNPGDVQIDSRIRWHRHSRRRSC